MKENNALKSKLGRRDKQIEKLQEKVEVLSQTIVALKSEKNVLVAEKQDLEAELEDRGINTRNYKFPEICFLQLFIQTKNLNSLFLLNPR